MDDDLHALAVRITAARDRLAEEALARALLPRLNLYARRYLGRVDAAADLAHDAMLIILGALRAGRVREPSKLAAFALTTCRTLMLDGKRTARRRDELLERADLELTVEPPDPARLDRDRIARGLATLEPRERVVIQLTFWEERSAEEIAQKLGLAAGHVRVIRHRAIERLAACVVDKEAS